MSPLVEIWPVLELLEDLERKAVTLYDRLRERFEDDEEAAQLFKHLSGDEVRHVNIIKFELGMVFRSRKEYQRVDADKDAIKAAGMAAKVVLDSVDSISLEDAVRFCVRLEEDGAEIYYRTKIVEANPKITSVIQSLASTEKKHLERLYEFAKARGIEVSLSEPPESAEEEDADLKPPPLEGLEPDVETGPPPEQLPLNVLEPDIEIEPPDEGAEAAEEESGE